MRSAYNSSLKLFSMKYQMLCYFAKLTFVNLLFCGVDIPVCHVHIAKMLKHGVDVYMLSNCQIVNSNLPKHQLHITTASFQTFQIDLIWQARKNALQTAPQKN